MSEQNDSTSRKRGRPPVAQPARDWLEDELQASKRLADHYREQGLTDAGDFHEKRADDLALRRPAKWRSGRSPKAYETRHPELTWHLTGTIEERQQQAIIDAVGAVKALLLARRAGLPLDELTRKAEAACAVCEALWRGDGSEQGRRGLRVALKRLDAGELNADHREGHQTDVLRVLMFATGISERVLRPHVWP